MYACEGLIYAGTRRFYGKYYEAGLKGIAWATTQIISSTGGLPRGTIDNKIEQTDGMAQLLRLLILSRNELVKKNFFNKAALKDIIDKLHSRLLDFYIPLGVDKGGIKYQLDLNTACSWCTLFSMQALRLWEIKDRIQDSIWINNFV